MSFVNGCQLAASKVKWNKGSADIARGARSSSRLALQETVQRNSPVLQSGPTAVTDSNNNSGKINVSVQVILVAKCPRCNVTLFQEQSTLEKSEQCAQVDVWTCVVS